MTSDERRRALEQIAAEVSVCMACPLGYERTTAVPGEGSAETEVVFVGEGPGYNEDQQGRPFVGAAGTLLNELLRQIGWKRQDVFITNVVKCRPPANRDPEPNEIEACAPFLKRQLAVLDPAVIVTLGRHSLQTFNPGARIGATHGTVRPVDAQTGARDAMTYAMYHPAAALRQGSLKQTMLEDMCGLPQALLDSRERRSPRAVAVAAEPAQLLEQTEPDIAPLVEPVDEQTAALEPAALEPAALDLAALEPVALEVEPELIAVAVGEPSYADLGYADAEPVDENQMSLF